MKRALIISLFGLILTLASAQVQDSPYGKSDPTDGSTNVLVVYYSVTGNTEKLAQAIASGAQKVSSVKVIVKTPDKVTKDDLISADAIILGSPTYYGNMCAQMKEFIDSWFLVYQVSLADKVGAAFSTGGGETGGKENVIFSLNIAMINAGMILVGPLENNLGAAGISSLDPVSESALMMAKNMGERAANIAQHLKNLKK